MSGALTRFRGFVFRRRRRRRRQTTRHTGNKQLPTAEWCRAARCSGRAHGVVHWPKTSPPLLPAYDRYARRRRRPKKKPPGGSVSTRARNSRHVVSAVRPSVRPTVRTRVSRPAAFVFVVNSYFLCRINKSKEHAQRHGPGGVIIKTTALFYIVLACWYCTHTPSTTCERSFRGRYSRDFPVLASANTPRTNKSVVEGLRRKLPSESKPRERAKLRGSRVHEPGKLSSLFFLITRHHDRYPLP